MNKIQELIKDRTYTKGEVAALAVGGACLSALTYFWYLGGFHKPKVTVGQYPGTKHVFYKEIQCGIRGLGKQFHIVTSSFFRNAALNPEKKTCDLQFNWRLWGVYYDNPFSLVDPSQMRAVIALEVTDDLTSEMIQNILAQDSSLKYSEPTPKCDCIRATFPYKSIFSYFIAARRTYPQITEFASQHEEWKEASPILSVERYDKKEGNIEFFYALKGNSAEALDSWMSISPPAVKDSN